MKGVATLPIYEYQCSQCGQIYEVFQSIKDEAMKKCKLCSGDVTKLISNCSFQLKGTGWYVTDYARKETDTASVGKKDKKNSEETQVTNDTSVVKKESTQSQKPE